MQEPGDTISNEVLAIKIASLAAQVDKVESKLDMYNSHFVPADIYDLRHRELEVRIGALSNQVANFGRNNTLRLWALGTVSAAAGIVLAYLVQFYLNHVGR